MKNFCSRPFTEMHFEENGGITPCCVMPSNMYPIAKGIDNYLNSEKLKEIKDYFLNNKRHPYCTACWDSEDNGVRSHRIYTEKLSEEIESIHIRYNNICNFKCRMCNPKFSSSWLQENKIHGYFQHEYSLDKDIFDINPDLLSFILKHKNTLKKIAISGGEPLIADANLFFLRWLYKNNLSDLSLSFSTNLSKIIHRNINIIDFLSIFTKVKLVISVDGYGKAVEYGRHGFKWDTFINNLNYTKKVKKSLIQAINCVVNIYSVYSIPLLAEFCAKNKLNLEFQPCLEPKFLSIQSLPYKEKEKILKYYQSIKKSGKLFFNKEISSEVLEYMMKDQINSYTIGEAFYDCNREFKKFNTLLDRTRKESFSEVFPMLSDWYDSI